MVAFSEKSDTINISNSDIEKRLKYIRYKSPQTLLRGITHINYSLQSHLVVSIDADLTQEEARSVERRIFMTPEIF